MSEPVDRREFVKTGVAAGAAVALTAASYDRVLGANENLRIAFLGVGGRCQQHVDVILRMRDEKKGVVPVAACDVWDGDPKKGFDRKTNTYKGQGLYPTAKRCGIDQGDKEHVTKDYRRVLDQKDVDITLIATPDHWHARMTIDALMAGKSVYCEKPMTRTIAEAHAVVDAWKKTGQVMTVGVQSMADPTWRLAHEYIRAGNIGKVLMGQTSYFRNSDVGQWRYYSITKDMNPKTIDWEMFLGHGFDVNGEKLGPTSKEYPFDRAVFAQWRCYWPFGGGMFTDLFVHQTTHRRLLHVVELQPERVRDAQRHPPAGRRNDRQGDGRQADLRRLAGGEGPADDTAPPLEVSRLRLRDGPRSRKRQIRHASPGSFPSTHGPASFMYGGGVSVLPLSPPVQPMMWLGLPRSLDRRSHMAAHDASASTGLRPSLSQNRALPCR